VQEILRESLIDLGSRLRRRDVSARELMEAVLERIDATHDRLLAFVALRDREALLADARAADERIARGEARALEGIPLGVKDLEHAAGLPNTEGSRLFEGRMSDYDETHVARLKAAGAIVVGKTNAPEFGWTAITKNLLHGVTRSPWDPEVTPGGSSGGSAAALAGCVCPLVTASDGGGSVRIPASFTGAFGLKPSYGRVPIAPLHDWPWGQTAVYGPLTKTVADGALYLDIVAGPDPRDPLSLPPTAVSYLDTLEEPLPSGLRIGFSPDLGYAVVQSDVADAVGDAVASFEKLGHSVRPIAGGPPQLGFEWAMLGSFELAVKLAEHLPGRADDLHRTLSEQIRRSTQLEPETWRKISDQRLALIEWCAGIFEEFDLLVTPTVPWDPPPAKGPFPRAVEGRDVNLASAGSFTIPFNLSWHPAATVRAGLSRRGLPIGMQIVGPRHRDDLVLRAARAFERERPWHPNWPTGSTGPTEERR
jgi:aspartyl-tRNA(Asn)/glutamyl-tRNA(Gln) amidotransferase subunit A